MGTHRFNDNDKKGVQTLPDGTPYVRFTAEEKKAGVVRRFCQELRDIGGDPQTYALFEGRVEVRLNCAAYTADKEDVKLVERAYREAVGK